MRVKVFSKVARLLKPGALFLFKTPNKWHYVPTIPRLTAHAFHQIVNCWRGRTAVDVFPTLYQANTKTDVERLAAKTGLDVVTIERLEQRPEYMRMSVPTYVTGAAYQRIVNSIRLLKPFRVLLIGELR